ncbi:PTS sugar transporter subunit IIB [Sutcliffiella horikoshii]|uniref:PTS sugar transporter subunit IIB n=1 Tax=Sutcliffiella horikoshii TaxID=79883 RepID=A0A1Y0CJQ2_9BACI|nr:PTS sugar transporter subunit IIB [Sutcliffiella horikoshii]ART75304.1 PTS sugar transporter subunit IIB [Sutcliffiella horikoshii]TYS58679.1 PTS sugar transporter subunit IIB [Sutcliffiella horikoshii]
MNILLCCSAGMSTSLLVTKMEKSVAEKGIDCKIWAVGSSEVKNHLEQADVLLVGPQVRYLIAQLQKDVQGRIPVEAINPMHYGLCNGEEVLNQAIALIKGDK